MACDCSLPPVVGAPGLGADPGTSSFHVVALPSAGGAAGPLHFAGRQGKGQGGAQVSLQGACHSFPLHLQELGHMATLHCVGGWEIHPVVCPG